MFCVADIKVPISRLPGSEILIFNWSTILFKTFSSLFEALFYFFVVLNERNYFLFINVNFWINNFSVICCFCKCKFLLVAISKFFMFCLDKYARYFSSNYYNQPCVPHSKTLGPYLSPFFCFQLRQIQIHRSNQLRLRNLYLP